MSLRTSYFLQNSSKIVLSNLREGWKPEKFGLQFACQMATNTVIPNLSYLWPNVHLRLNKGSHFLVLAQRFDETRAAFSSATSSAIFCWFPKSSSSSRCLVLDQSSVIIENIEYIFNVMIYIYPNSFYHYELPK